MTTHTPEQLRSLYDQSSKLWRGEFSHAAEILDDGFIVHQARPDGSDSELVTGPERLLPEIEQTMAAFGDINITVDLGPFVDGDFLAARWTMTATYSGGIPHATAPIGTRIAFSGHDTLRVAEHKFIEYWTCTDMLDGLAQLGAVSGPNGPAQH